MASPDVSARDRSALLPLVLASGLLAAGVAAKLSCLGADGLTLVETALPWCYSDVAGLFQGRGLAADPLPYRDVLTEYPPLTALQWWLAGSVTRTVTGFYLATAALQVGAMLVTVWLLARSGLPDRRVLLVAAAPALLLTATVNWDPVAVLLLTAGLLADREGRPRAAGMLLGLGGLAKVFPLLAVAVLVVGDLRAGAPRRAATLGTVAAGTVLGVQVPVALWAPGEWDAWIELNATRPVDWDTLWYGIQALSRRVLPAQGIDLVIVAVTLTGWAIAVRADRWRADPMLPVVGWLLLAGKVWSPQFTLWLLPLLALSRVPTRLAWPFLVADATVVLARFPFLAGQQGLSPSVPYSVFGATLLLRGGLLLAILLRGPDPLPVHPPEATADPHP